MFLVVVEPAKIVLLERRDAKQSLSLALLIIPFFYHVDVAWIRVKLEYAKEVDLVLEAFWIQPACHFILEAQILFHVVWCQIFDMCNLLIILRRQKETNYNENTFWVAIYANTRPELYPLQIHWIKLFSRVQCVNASGLVNVVFLFVLWLVSQVQGLT